jgi:hypothetical protein
VTPVICRTHSARLVASQQLACSPDSASQPLVLSHLQYEFPAD